jgi:hypothetical protein
MSPWYRIIPLTDPEYYVVNPKNPCGALDHRIQYRLHIRERAADDAKHLGGCSLMLQGSVSSLSNRSFSLAVAFSRCNDSASCWRSSAFVCACLTGDIFAEGPRRFGFSLRAFFRGHKNNERPEVVAGETEYWGSVWRDASPAAELTFTSGR